MREILFRGKRIDGGAWAEGCLIKVTLGGKTVYLIFGDDFTFDGTDVKALNHALVDPATVGQYTGLNAKGKKIFEGDILRGAVGDMVVFYGEIIGEGYGFHWKAVDGGACESMTGFIDEYEIVGNIHDNPELLEGGNT